jgi:hypothetical protein
VIFGLGADFEEAEGAVGVQGGGGQHSEEVWLADVVRARASNQDATGSEHFEGAEVEFFVAAEGGVEISGRSSP